MCLGGHPSASHGGTPSARADAAGKIRRQNHTRQNHGEGIQSPVSVARLIREDPGSTVGSRRFSTDAGAFAGNKFLSMILPAHGFAISFLALRAGFVYFPVDRL
jgi:hypothetical protein